MSQSLPADKYDWVGTIQTFTGAAFDIVNPSADQLNLDDIAQSLSLICRFNGHLPTHYSVAEHSVRVAWWLSGNNYGPEVILTGLLHDASEAYVGDMVRPLKQYPALGSMHQRLETRIAELVHARYGGIFPHPPEIHQADRLIYDWEVALIRSGSQPGWPADQARTQFLAMFHALTEGR